MRVKENKIVTYKTATGKDLPVQTDGETVWMTVVNVQNLHIIQNGRGRPELTYDLDVLISVGYRVKSVEGVRFRRWATRVLREMLLNRLDEVREIGKLKRRMDAAEGDIKQIKGGMSYLVKQLSGPDIPRRKIGFGVKPGETSDTPYGCRKVIF